MTAPAHVSAGTSISACNVTSSMVASGTLSRCTGDTVPLHLVYLSDVSVREVPKPGNEKLPIKMLNDRLLVQMPRSEGERRSTGGILIPATAQVAKRLAWAEVVAVGANVRTIEQGDQVLFSPEDRHEIEVGGQDYIILRERDIHAVAS